MLPSPYATKCRDHEKEWLGSRIGCLYGCRLGNANDVIPIVVPVFEHHHIGNNLSKGSTRAGCEKVCWQSDCRMKFHSLTSHRAGTSNLDSNVFCFNKVQQHCYDDRNSA